MTRDCCYCKGSKEPGSEFASPGCANTSEVEVLAVKKILVIYSESLVPSIPVERDAHSLLSLCHGILGIKK
ncbi:hypothetical protein PF005_g2592 [Phytophthora fragariae]|uniref:Uncharacterized protein n=1 Tax=Phytophthora fragariae TaxID=53985 RepID=A0A6A4ACC3_9STRA|nr:hypothetical protein PF003_g10759 [Phytophthora fragariae]KAE8947000.1 hypothetical protein PF009_g3390 [Phytophthora fragariae]KAE9134141.1 hypothetical protein PF010_g2560 [Phytophthora fragariae]KAE9134534.1 hypothetical protein PF007_g2898 [Phytophthora fragariae]KAE9153692.1 hypothetical protein PF006_g2215 [Phytophthora fragariae]